MLASKGVLLLGITLVSQLVLAAGFDNSTDSDDLSDEALQEILFSSGTGNGFVDEHALDKSWLDSTETALELELCGADLDKDFDVDGIPTRPIEEICGNQSSLTDGLDLKQRQIRGSCPWEKAQSRPCTSQFREPEGLCTNLIINRKTWGMSDTPYTRVLRPKYEDGMIEMRKTEFRSRRTLKSAREISCLVTTQDVLLADSGHNAHVMQWGQFMAHDLSQLVPAGNRLTCCPDKELGRSSSSLTPDLVELGRELIQRKTNGKCMAVEIERDPVHGQYLCMHQVRTKESPTHDCRPGPRQQRNGATHLIDASAVYGSNRAKQNSLRTLSGGRMKIQSVGGKVLLPPANSCSSKDRARQTCPFSAGDGRVGVTPNLAATHTVFVLKHNQIADELSRINPQWNDERTFQETRRIINGIMANIHYYEWLPIIIGNRNVAKYNLNNYQGFDESVNPSVLNEMAGAAMRFGHSLIDGQLSAVDSNGNTDVYSLSTAFINHQSLIYQKGIAACLKGLMIDRPWKADNKFPAAMRDRLFRGKKDIVSLNINRGRDHGFASYLDYRRHYGLSVARSFNDLFATHSHDVVNGLKEAYTSVEDIELYIGGVTEVPMPGAFVGELFANILGDGFSRLMRGDRFYFENTQGELNTDQIKAIKDYKYHQLLCEASGMDRVNNNAFFTLQSERTREVKCSELTPLNLNLWGEGQTTTPSQLTKLTNILRPTNSRPAPTSSTPCRWQTTGTTDCCVGFGSRVTTRTCIRRGDCTCQGSTKITQKCTCGGAPCTAKDLEATCRTTWRSLGISPPSG